MVLYIYSSSGKFYSTPLYPTLSILLSLLPTPCLSMYIEPHVKVTPPLFPHLLTLFLSETGKRERKCTYQLSAIARRALLLREQRTNQRRNRARYVHNCANYIRYAYYSRRDATRMSLRPSGHALRPPWVHRVHR